MRIKQILRSTRVNQCTSDLELKSGSGNECGLVEHGRDGVQTMTYLNTRRCDRRELRTLSSTPEISGLQRHRLRSGHFFSENVLNICKFFSESVQVFCKLFRKCPE